MDGFALRYRPWSIMRWLLSASESRQKSTQSSYQRSDCRISVVVFTPNCSSSYRCRAGDVYDLQQRVDRATLLDRTQFVLGNPVQGSRQDSRPPAGGPPGSDSDFLREQLIDAYGHDYAVLLPRAFCNLHPDPDFGSAIAAAYNEWLADTWLTKYNHDGLFKGSITVAHQDPQAAPNVGQNLRSDGRIGESGGGRGVSRILCRDR